VHRLFEAQAEQAPDALAVAAGRIRMSYGELNRRANQVAHYLRRRGVGPDSLVALCLDRSPALVVAVLGVLKAGGAYVPLDPAHPAERLSFMLHDAGTGIVLTEARWLAQLSGAALPVLCLDRDQEQLASESKANTDGRAELANLAYAIYTSGSTGWPKGVLIQHDGLANLVAWHQATYSVTAADRATLLATPAFDASVWEIWPYLAAGASLHIPDAETRDTPDSLLRWMNEQRITLSFVPTPLMELLYQEAWPEGMALRALLTGGDRLHRGPDRRLPCRVYNHYGPTENSVVATWAPVDPWAEGAGPPPIGRNCQL
jgi:amino acid adenylation domain-containing protein